MILRAACLTASLVFAFTAAATAEVPALPDSTAKDRSAVAVTIYNVNIGLVRENRTLRVDRSGVGTLRFMDVPSSIDPRTVHLRSLSSAGGISVLEQNYEYDLLSPEKLMEKYVGQDVEIVEQAQDLTSRKVQATLLSVNGAPVYRVGDRIVVNQTGKVTFPSVPKDLVATPTLVWTVDAAKSGSQAVEASYLTEGMTWSADYVAVVDADDAKAGLTGWVTVENHSGAAFEDAVLKLVAGDVRRVTPERQPTVMTMQADVRAKAAGSAFQEESFFEYHLYTLDRPTTLKQNQTKQIGLFQASDVPVTKRLILTGQPWYYRNQGGDLTHDEKVQVVLELKNSAASGLGMPLPKGTVRVYKKDRSSSEQFVGEDAIDHTPKDETVRLHIGDAFDVVADRRQTDWKVVSPREFESAYAISIRNRKDEDVTVTVREPVGGDWKLLDSSVPGKKLDAGTLEFEVRAPKNKETRLTYRIATRY